MNSLWHNLEVLEKISKAWPFISITVGACVAMLVQYGGGIVKSRVDVLKVKVELQRKHTSPNIDAQLALSDKGNLLIVIDAHNLIPFKARWVIVTERDVIVSGLMLGDAEFHPMTDKKRWQEKVDIQRDKVVNDFLELRFDYTSVYVAELNYPKELSGEIVRKYKLVDGYPRPID